MHGPAWRSAGRGAAGGAPSPNDSGRTNGLLALRHGRRRLQVGRDVQPQPPDVVSLAYVQFHLDGHKPWHPDFRYSKMGWLPNMSWPRAIGAHLQVVALKAPKLLEGMFNSRGEWKLFMDEYLSDGRFYNEEFDSPKGREGLIGN